MKETDLLHRTSLLLKKTPDAGGLVRNRFTKPRPNIRALSSNTAANVSLSKQAKVENKEKDEKGSEDIKDSGLPSVEKADEGFNVSEKTEVSSASTKTAEQKDICEDSSSNVPMNSFPEKDLSHGSVPSIESVEDTVSSSLEMEEGEKVKESRGVDDTTSCAKSVENMPFRSKRHFKTAFEKEILSLEDVNKTPECLEANILNSPEKIFVSEKTTKPRKKLATACLTSPVSDNGMNCESLPTGVSKETTVPCSMTDEESIDNPPSCVTMEGSSENHKSTTDNENPPAAVNDIVESSPLKNISNSPRKRKIRKQRQRLSKAKAVPPRNEMKMADLIDYIPDGPPMKYTNSQISVENKDRVDVENKDSENSIAVEEKEEDSSVPRVVIGENGEIILDESSLVIRRKENSYTNTSAEMETDNTTYSSFRKQLSKKWTFRETLKFYKALTIVGTDFALMEIIFKNDWKIKKSRHELKLKFKLEERHNPEFVFKAMYESEMWDISILQNDSDNIIDSSEVEDEPPNSQSNTESDTIQNKQKDGEKESIPTEDSFNHDQMVL